MGRVLGWHIDLLGWEDTLPGAVRPQELINQDVDVCDLFVGLLYKKWGTPTGSYSSGFEEEYERAYARKTSSGSPEMWLFFKAVDKELLEDPGEHLQRVLRFKADQQGKVLYKEVSDCGDWTDQLSEYLNRYIARCFREEQEARQKAQSATPVEATETEVLGGPATEDAASKRQLQDVFAQAEAVLADDDDAVSRLAEETLTRLYLVGASWLGFTRTGEGLSVHALNLVYKHRAIIDPSPIERQMLSLSLVLHHGAENAPGWYWLREFSAEEQEEAVADIAWSHSDPTSRVAALELMTKAKLELPDEDVRHLMLRPALAIPEVAPAALRYVASIGGATEIELLDELLAEDWEGSRDIARTRMLILARLDPGRAYRAVLTTPTPPRAILERLTESRYQINRADGLSGLSHRDREMRVFTITRMSATRTLRKGDAVRLLEDPAFSVRSAAVRAVLRHGWSVDRARLEEAIKPSSESSDDEEEEESLRKQIFENLSRDELAAELSWFSPAGPAAYRALVLHHFDEFGEDARLNLRNSFDALRERGLEKDRAAFGEAVNPLYEERGAVYYFLLSKFVSAALEGLAANGDKRDLELARRYLRDERPEPQLMALALIARIGTAQDVESVLPLTMVYATRERASAVAMKLADDKAETASVLLGKGDPVLAKHAIEALPNDAAALEVLKDLLSFGILGGSSSRRPCDLPAPLSLGGAGSIRGVLKRLSSLLLQRPHLDRPLVVREGSVEDPVHQLDGEWLATGPAWCFGAAISDLDKPEPCFYYRTYVRIGGGPPRATA